MRPCTSRRLAAAGGCSSRAAPSGAVAPAASPPRIDSFSEGKGKTSRGKVKGGESCPGSPWESDGIVGACPEDGVYGRFSSVKLYAGLSRI